MTVFVAMYVSIGLESECRPECLGVFSTFKEAENEVFKSMDLISESAVKNKTDFEIDFTNRIFYTRDGKEGMRWNIEKVEFTA